MSQENSISPEEIPPRTGIQFLHSSNFWVLVFGSVMLLGLLALAWIGRPPRSVMVGQQLPRLDLQPLVHTDTGVTNDQLRGKLSVIHFWGTWCPPCQREFPEFAELVAEFQGHEQVAIVSVSCSPGPETDLEQLQRETSEFLAEYSHPIPTYSDSAAMTREQLRMLSSTGSFGYPTTLLVDREGVIIEALDGYFPGEMEKLADQIRASL